MVETYFQLPLQNLFVIKKFRDEGTLIDDRFSQPNLT